MSNSLIKSDENNQVIIPEVLETPYGKYLRKSTICPICLRLDHMEINMMRSRNHMTYGEIAGEKHVTIHALDLHFKNHFQVSQTNKDIIDLKENSNQESNEVIEKILEGNVDFFGGAQSVLTSKAQRLLPILNKLKILSDKAEIDDLEDIERQDYILLNKLAEDIENSIMKIHNLIDKKMFPSSKEEIARAVMSYKLSILNKFVDDIILVLIEFEKHDGYKDLIQQIRFALSQRISNLEAIVVKSGGELKAVETNSEDGEE